jgi:hypothetical protein
MKVMLTKTSERFSNFKIIEIHTLDDIFTLMRDAGEPKQIVVQKRTHVFDGHPSLKDIPYEIEIYDDWRE